MTRKSRFGFIPNKPAPRRINLAALLFAGLFVAVVFALTGLFHIVAAVLTHAN